MGDNFDYDTLAMHAYEAYGATTKNMNYLGHPMPMYAQLPQRIRDAWVAAVKQVTQEVKNQVLEEIFNGEQTEK